MKKVSIMIPTYNQEKYIVQTVESALSQDYLNLEVIVSDDCSTDNTGLVLKRFINDKRFVYHKNTKNIGRVANYRRVLNEYAIGDFCLCLDGDDYLIDTHFISETINFIEENKLVFVFAKHKVFFNSRNAFIIDTMNDSLPKIIDGQWLFSNYYRGYSIPHLCTLYNRKLAIEVGYYTRDILSSDWESVLKLMLKGRVGFLNRCVGVWRKHDKNESKTENLEKVLDNVMYITSASKYALDNGYFMPIIIEKWKSRMLRRYFIKLLIRFRLQNNTLFYKKTLTFFKERYPWVYYLTLFDIRVIVLLILVGNKTVGRFILKRILGIESFFEDFS